MTLLELSPFLYLSAFLVLLMGGFFPFLPGKNAARAGSYLSAFGFLVLVAAGSITLHLLIEGDFAARLWARGWIGPREAPGALTLGVYQDLVGVVISILIGLVALTTTLSKAAAAREPSEHSEISGLALGALGVVAAWLSLTPWACIAALSLTLFGGFFGLKQEWKDDLGTQHALRFIRERSLGLMLLILGAAAIFSSRGLIQWDKKGELSSFSGMSGFDLFSVSLFYLGVFMQFQPFPFQGWLNSKKAPGSFFSGWVLSQSIPAAAAFALLFRMEPYLKETGTLDVFGCVALCSASLLGLFGIFQTEWRPSVAIWIASGFSLSVAALALGGPSAGLPIFLAIFLASTLLSTILSPSIEAVSAPLSGQFALVLVGASILGCFGIFGFYSGDGFWAWLSPLTFGSGLSFAPLLPFLLFAVCGFLTFLRIRENPIEAGLRWPRLLAGTTLFLVMLSFFWSGSPLGPLSSELFLSLNSHFFEKTGGDPATAVTYWVQLGLILVALGIALVLFRKLASVGKFGDFVRSGFEIDRFSRKLISIAITAGEFTARWVDTKAWSDWMPKALNHTIHGIAEPGCRIDDEVTGGIRKVVLKSVAVPALLAQLIQNGDVQWYLFFGIGTGLAMLIHFVKP